MEDKIIRSCLVSRDAYEKLANLPDWEVEVSDLGRLLLKLVKDYYDTDKNADSVDVDIIKSKIKRDYPKISDHFTFVLSSLDEVSPSNVIKELQEIRLANVKQAMIESIATNSSDKLIREYVDKYVHLLEGLEDNKEEEREQYIDVHPTTFLDGLVGQNLIKLYPNSLNEAIGGGVPPESVIIIFARPDTGKTALVISQIAGSCRDGKKVVYAGNEDPTKKMLQRIMSRMSNMTIEQIASKPDEAYSKAVARGYRNLVYVPLTPGSVDELEAIVAHHQPDVLIIDQLRNITAKREENNTVRLEAVAMGARRLAKKYGCVVFATTQAGATGADKLVLSMEDIDGSKTGIQGQADLIVGLGTNDEYKTAGRLMITIDKNKINGELAHFPVRINKCLSKVIS